MGVFVMKKSAHDDRVLFLSEDEIKRLAIWLGQVDKVPAGFNRGRFFQLQMGLSNHITFKELGILCDDITSWGFGLDIIRGACVVSIEDVIHA